MNILTRYLENFDWEGIELHPYKDNDGNPSFKDVTRQTIFKEDKANGLEVRYFEIAASGYTSLEKHEHTHIVVPIRGSGSCLVANTVTELRIHECVYVPSWAWHQFRASEAEPLGFLCLVNVERDRPTLPTAYEVKDLQKTPEIARFIRPRRINP